MVPFGTKALYGMAFLAAIAAFVMGVVTSDAVGTTLLIFVSGGAAAVGTVILVADPDRAPWFAPDTPLGQQSPAGGRPAMPSPWPLGAAVALGLLALGAVTDAVVIAGAAVLMAVVGVGWFLQQFSEHPSFTAHYGARLKERLVLPILLPLGVIALVAVIAASLSRIFLALPEQGTRAVALAVAVVILFSATAIAMSGDRMGRTALALLSGLALVCVIGAGIAGLSHGERKFETPKPIPHAPLPPGINPSVIATQGGTGSAGGSTTTTSTGP